MNEINKVRTIYWIMIFSLIIEVMVRGAAWYNLICLGILMGGMFLTKIYKENSLKLNKLGMG